MVMQYNSFGEENARTYIKSASQLASVTTRPLLSHTPGLRIAVTLDSVSILRTCTFRGTHGRHELYAYFESQLAIAALAKA